MTETAARVGVRRTVAVAIVAILVLACAEVFVRIRSDQLPPHQIWSSPEMQYKATQIRALQESGGASVVFLGSSSIDAAVDASAITDPQDPRPAYNAGLGGGSAAMISTWAREVVPRLKPRVVVLGLGGRELNPNNKTENDLDRNFFASPAVKHLRGKETTLDTAERHLESWSALFKYRTVMRQPQYMEKLFGFGDAPGPNYYGQVVTPSGQHLRFHDVSYTFGPSVRRLYTTRALNHFRVGPRRVAQVRTLLSYLDARGIRVILVNMPVTQDFVDLHPRGRTDYDLVPPVLKGQADAVGATFFNPGVWEQAYFADPGHMNARGSVRFTTLLQEQITALR